MRLYTFVNFYLSSIQQGIQTQHAASEIYNDYLLQHLHFTSDGRVELDLSPGKVKMLKELHDWSMNHKTTIVLNGGISADILALRDLLLEIGDDLGYPWSTFREDEQSLDGMMTAVAIVLPEEIYDAQSYYKFFNGTIPCAKPLTNSWYYGTPPTADKPERDYIEHKEGSVQARFLDVMKRCGLAK